MHQDHLSGTSVVTSDNGTLISSIKYYPFGGTRSGDVPTDVKFTGQRYDEGTGLYYYGARYYDPVTGRFISADTIIPNPADPQCYNRYSYCINNPLKYVDPTGHWGNIVTIEGEDYTLDPRTGRVTKISDMTQQRPSVSDGSEPDMPFANTPNNFLQIMSVVGAGTFELGGSISGSLTLSTFASVTTPLVIIAEISYITFILNQWIADSSAFTETEKLIIFTGGDAMSIYVMGVQGTGMPGYNYHQDQLKKMKQQLDDLSNQLKNAKGPKKQKPIKEAIEKLIKKIKGELKEIKQKWPDGPPSN